MCKQPPGNLNLEYLFFSQSFEGRVVIQRRSQRVPDKIAIFFKIDYMILIVHAPEKMHFFTCEHDITDAVIMPVIPGFFSNRYASK